MKEIPKKARILHCLDVESWRIFSDAEMLDYLNRGTKKEKSARSSRQRLSILAVRKQLSPVDIYCYLKARFGNPNGIQTLLAEDDSDNWIHWDYNIKSGKADIVIAGTSREIHFIIDESLQDSDWCKLIKSIKSDFKRIGKEKGAVFKTLEKWVVFSNRFVEIANLCAKKHETITAYLEDRPVYQVLSPRSKKSIEQYQLITNAANKRRSAMANSALELSLLTPVMAEAYINMVILILCKKDVRLNKRQFDSFIRSDIDTKVFDLSYKCDGFMHKITPDNIRFKSFKRVMDKRNHAIHGNVDPEREQIETVYFEGKRPLYKESGDHIEKFFDSIERRAEPETVLKDYEDTHEFLEEIAACLAHDLQKTFRRIIEDSQPGFDINRKITGVLFSNVIVTGKMRGLKYDDELDVDWES